MLILTRGYYRGHILVNKRPWVHISEQHRLGEGEGGGRGHFFYTFRVILSTSLSDVFLALSSRKELNDES